MSALADTDGNGRFDEGTCTTMADVNHDGFIDCIGNGTITSGRTNKVLAGYPLAHTANWMVGDDLDNDGRMEIITTSTDGKAYCYRLGEGSWTATSLLTQMYTGVTPIQRNGNIDSFEPNDRVEGADGVVTLNLATRYTQKDNAFYPYRAFISSPGDVDWYEVSSSQYMAEITSPTGKDYDVAIYCENKNKTAGQPALVKLSESTKTTSVETASAGYSGYNQTVKDNCASMSHFFVKVWGKTATDFGTRPYLLRSKLY
jgi:hypothetical protein